MSRKQCEFWKNFWKFLLKFWGGYIRIAPIIRFCFVFIVRFYSCYATLWKLGNWILLGKQQFQMKGTIWALTQWKFWNWFKKFCVEFYKSFEIPLKTFLIELYESFEISLKTFLVELYESLNIFWYIFSYNFYFFFTSYLFHSMTQMVASF